MMSNDWTAGYASGVPYCSTRWQQGRARWTS